MSGKAMDTALRLRRRHDEKSTSGRSFLLVLFGAFAVIMLIALLVGLQGYRAIADERSAIDEQRVAYGSLVNTVKAFDAADAFSVGEYDGNEVLAMVQRTTTGTYLMRLYVHDGMLMQQFSLPEADIDPANAHPLFPTKTFAVDYTDGLLTLVTDQASPCVRLACPQPSLLPVEPQGEADMPEAGDE